VWWNQRLYNTILTSWCWAHVLETCRGTISTYCKTKFCASSWLITKINILRCTVSKTSKNAVLNFGIIISILVFQVSVLSSVIPRNFLLQILVTFLFSWVIYKSIKELVLVTNYIKCVLSVFSDYKLVLYQLFISCKI